MKINDIGMLWQDLPSVRKKGGPRERGPMPDIPATGWTPPSEFPNLAGAKIIGVDTETYDPELTTAGPGWGRGKGHIIGASLAVEDGTSWYFPIRHGWEPVADTGEWRQVLPPEEAAMNMDPEQVLRFLDHTLHDNRPKVGANLIYDIGWLNWEGVRVGGFKYDVQFAEALLDSETPGVALDDLGLRHLGIGKTTSILYDWLATWCGGAATDRQRANLYLSPPSLAGPYAESDASLPIDILKSQWPLMEQRGVLDLFHLECRLIPLLVAMRMKGAPIDVGRIDEIYDKLGSRLKGLESIMHDLAGQPVNPNAADSIKAAFQAKGIPLPTKIHKQKATEVVSFDKARLESVEHPLAAAILDWRKLAKVQGTFIDSYLRKKHVNGRVFCSFHPLKGATNGTRSGRLASSDPNLQNIPVRTDEGRLVREAFAVDPALGRWRSFDYSSIEYRLLVHFAVGPGADEVRAQFARDPTTDYHQFVMELIDRMVGILLERGKTKTINFGIIYGMALNALATALGLPKAEAKKLLDAYHEAIPYARVTMDACADEVHQTGMVRTILNRASDFSVWGPKAYQEGGRPPPMDYDKAARIWGPFNIERQHTHKALNRKLQGSAADVMKKAMVDAYEGGLFADDACGIPILTVHDELDFEDLGDPDNPAWGELKRVMENCMGGLLRVPLIVDGDVGKSWAEAH